MSKKKDLTGQKFGRLTVLEEAPAHQQSKRTRRTKWKCQCDCGNIVEVQTSNLTRANNSTRSCGCLLKERPQSKVRKTHGLSKFPLYGIWRCMNSRCNNPDDVAYKYYGAKGVCVCPEWHQDNPDGLQNFTNDMEANYVEGYQLDKDIRAIPGQPKCYSKDTCCWVTPAKNNRTRSSSKLTRENVKYIKQELAKGRTYKDLAEEFNVNKATISHINTDKTWAKI